MRKVEFAGRGSAPETIDAGPAPILQWLPIANLVIDDAYQRDLKNGNWKAIQAIAAQFKWSRFSPVFVSPIEGGKFAIIDGQHRTHAAAMCGFTEVPCQIVQMSREEQAAAFAAVNGLVTKVTTWQIYKAAHAAGEPWARQICEVAESAGCKVMFNNTSSYEKKPGQIYAIKMLREMVGAYGKDRVGKALRILMQVEGIKDNPQAWDGMILSALISAMCHRAPAMEHHNIRWVLEEFDVLDVLDRIAQSNKDRMRRGLPYVGKRQQLEDRIIALLDEKLPARMALPA